MTVLAPDDAEAFQLSADDEAALLAAIEDANGREVIDGEQCLRDLGGRE